MDAEDSIRSLVRSNPLREPLMRDLIGDLPLPEGSCGLDAGCGVGLQSLLLADRVGPGGHVTGFDLSADMLKYAREEVARGDLGRRIAFCRGDLGELPFAEGAFDWAWSADCVGYSRRAVPWLDGLARVVRPGGLVAIAAWSSERLLPGHPELEARLAATSAGIAPFERGDEPGTHFPRALGRFRRLGLRDVRARALSGIVHAPLTDEQLSALAELLAQRWPDVSAELTPRDLSLFRRLCRPDSPEFIVRRPDYCAAFTYTMFWGRVPAPGALE